MPKTTPVPPETKLLVRQHAVAHPEMSARQIAKQVGLHHKTVSRILHSGPAQPEETVVLEDVQNDEPTGQWVQGERYIYNGETDTYVTFIKCRTTPLILSGTKFRSMKKAYSNWKGTESTVNEICRQFAIPRDQFTELKTVHGWTHDQEPFTREEMCTREVEDLATDAFQQRRQAVWENFAQKKWKQIKVDSEKWNNLEQNFIIPLQEQIGSLVPAYAPSVVAIKKSRNPFAVVTSAGELHYGGAGWVMETGEAYSRAEASDRLHRIRGEMLEEVADKGRPEKIFYAVGNDFLTVDTDLGTTTKGTPQEMDGTAAQILSEGLDLAIRDIDALRAVSPVHILPTPGNHDRLLTTALIKFIQAWYKKDKDVVVEFTARSRSYFAYGDTLGGVGHGDGALKPKDFMATMAKEAPDLWRQTRHRAFFTGHLHSEVVRELIGGTHYQMPSLRGKDRYHERNAYLADSALASYLIDKQRGVTNSIMTRV
jgi:hypothetical protein